MAVSKQHLLEILPPYRDEWVTITRDQDVRDIMKDIVKAHHEFAGYYDLIAPDFICPTLQETCDQLYDFCKQNIRYKEETEAKQTTALPTGILYRGYGDCKHYASFIGGVLGAVQRLTGEKINWWYCFASYKPEQRTPYHVFVVVDLPGVGEYYVDPTPGADGREPFWVIKERIKEKSLGRVALGGFHVNKAGELLPAAVGAAGPGASGTLIPAPSWYPSYLPKFYRQSNGQILLRPLNSVPNYTENDVLDCLLYYQTIIGFERSDSIGSNYIITGHAQPAAWKTTNGQTGATWVKSAFKTDAAGDGSGDFANVPVNNRAGIDSDLYGKMQERYVTNNAAGMPWLSAMQAVGGGIDLMTIPFATDTEVPRPSWYAEHLPSLFISAGEPYQPARGSLNTKPKINGWKTSTTAAYVPTANEIAQVMLYAAPVVIDGPTPYPLNWYVNDDVNGAMSSYFRVTLATSPGHTNAQAQGWAAYGSMMQQPPLDADPYTSGFGKTLQTIVSAAINFFAGKIPGGSTAIKAGYAAGTLTGGEVITGGPVPPGIFSAAVFKAANDITATLKKKAAQKNILLIVLLFGGGLAYYYRDEIKKYF